MCSYGLCVLLPSQAEIFYLLWNIENGNNLTMVFKSHVFRKWLGLVNIIRVHLSWLNLGSFITMKIKVRHIYTLLVFVVLYVALELILQQSHTRVALVFVPSHLWVISWGWMFGLAVKTQLRCQCPISESLGLISSSSSLFQLPTKADSGRQWLWLK